MRFEEKLMYAGPIHVAIDNGGCFAEDPIVTLLEPDWARDRKHIKPKCSFKNIVGRGTKEDPKRYGKRHPEVSLHYVVVDLFDSILPGRFIKVDKWLLKVTEDGVVSKDNFLTVLNRR